MHHRRLTILLLFIIGISSSITYSSPSDTTLLKSYTKKDLEGKFTLDTNYQILGFHPYWMNNAYKSYNYSLLTMVAFVSYEVNPATGNSKSLHGWEKSSLIETAKSENPLCKVLLTVTNFGREENSTLLNNPKARQRLIENLLFNLRQKKADGIVIDFEVLDTKDKNVFSEFIKEIKNAFQKEDEKYILTITLPAFDIEHAFDVELLSKQADWMLIMCYGDFDSTNLYHHKPAPLAPLKNNTRWNYSIESSMNQYIKEGVPSKKLLPAVAYYGGAWNIVSKGEKIISHKFISFVPYKNIQSMFKSKPELDTASHSVFYKRLIKDNQFRLYWFEDTTSLGYKYDYIKENKLGGVGIFALGYDRGNPELWDLLQRKFSYQPTEIKKEKHIEKTIRQKNSEVSLETDLTNKTYWLVIASITSAAFVFFFFRRNIFYKKK